MSRKLETIIILFLLTAQVSFWYGTKNIKPDLSVVPNLHSMALAKALSFGDEKIYHRINAFKLQNAGDSFGRVTPLYKYDYAELYKWWIFLDEFDFESNYVPSLAGYYYSASQKPKKDVPYVVKYLYEHGKKDPLKKWWWLAQAVYNAKHKLKDIDLAVEISDLLSDLPESDEIPIWVYQLNALALEDRGDIEESCNSIVHIIQNFKNLNEGEKNYINYFLRDRLEAIEDKYDEGDSLTGVCEAVIKQKKKSDAKNLNRGSERAD